MATSLNSLQETTNARHAPARPLVLVAEDHEDTRLLFRTMLELRGYSVIEAADGEETVRTAQSARPDLILMDGGLPRLSGVDATRRIRGADHIAHVPIVFVSGHAGAAFLALAREAGCDEFLVKPVDLAQLEDVLENIVAINVRSWVSIKYYEECLNDERLAVDCARTIRAVRTRRRWEGPLLPHGVGRQVAGHDRTQLLR